jgi:hypothetical protein
MDALKSLSHDVSIFPLPDLQVQEWRCLELQEVNQVFSTTTRGSLFPRASCTVDDRSLLIAGASKEGIVLTSLLNSWKSWRKLSKRQDILTYS